MTNPEIAEQVSGRFEVTANEEARKAIHLRTLLDQDLRVSLAHTLVNRCWLVLDAGSECSFLTSDHPVVYRGHAKHSWRTMQGLGCPQVELAWPLSPRYLLYVVDPGKAPSRWRGGSASQEPFRRAPKTSSTTTPSR